MKTSVPAPFVVGYGAANPGARYIVAGPGALANIGRSTITTPPINNWGTTLVKHIAVTERMRIDVMAGFLSAFNHPQYTTGSVNQANSISVCLRNLVDLYLQLRRMTKVPVYP